MRLKRLISLFGVILVLAGTEVALAKKVTLRFTMGHDAQTFGVIEKNFIENFNVRHPNIQVKGEVVPWDEFQQKYLPQIAAGTAPDVFGNIHFTWSQQWIREGALLNLSPYIKASNYDLQDFFPVSLEPYQYGDGLYCLAFDMGAEIIFLNVDMFNEVGLPYPDIDTWDINTFLAYCLKLTRDIDGDGTTDTWGFHTGASHTSLDGLLRLFGGGLMNREETECLIMKPASLRGLAFWWSNLVHQFKVTPPLAVRTGLSVLGGTFPSGKVAMLIQGGWMMPAYSKRCKFEWDLVRMPRGPAGRTATAGGAGVGIYAKSKYPEEAWIFVKEFTSEEGAKAWMLETGAAPPRKSVSSLVEKQPGMPTHIAVFREALENEGVISRPIGPRASEIYDAIKPEIEALDLGKKIVIDVARAIEEKIEGILK